MDKSEREKVIKLIRREVIPAIGCTEPMAVALCVAKATEILEKRPEQITVFLSANILKNAMGVGIPGTGMIGLPIAIALGALIGKSKYQLEVLKDCTPSDVKQGQKIIDSNTKLVAFTFDDGPSHNTAKIVDILKKYNATATFFVLGNKVEKYHKTIKYLNDNNMEIGNHTYTHILLTKLNEEKILKEIEDTQNAIYNQIGKYPYFFRPSYGTVSRKIKKTSPLPLVIWSLDTLDWKYHNSKKITNKILSKVKDGDIILMHDTYTATLNAVKEVIPKLKEMGYEIVSVNELFYYKNKEARLGYYYGSL